jgi:hypothetical protein
MAQGGCPRTYPRRHSIGMAGEGLHGGKSLKGRCRHLSRRDTAGEPSRAADSSLAAPPLPPAVTESCRPLDDPFFRAGEAVKDRFATAFGGAPLRRVLDSLASSEALSSRARRRAPSSAAQAERGGKSLKGRCRHLSRRDTAGEPAAPPVRKYRRQEIDGGVRRARRGRSAAASPSNDAVAVCLDKHDRRQRGRRQRHTFPRPRIPPQMEPGGINAQ